MKAVEAAGPALVEDLRALVRQWNRPRGRADRRAR